MEKLKELLEKDDLLKFASIYKRVFKVGKFELYKKEGSFRFWVYMPNSK